MVASSVVTSDLLMAEKMACSLAVWMERWLAVEKVVKMVGWMDDSKVALSVDTKVPLKVDLWADGMVVKLVYRKVDKTESTSVNY